MWAANGGKGHDIGKQEETFSGARRPLSAMEPQCRQACVRPSTQHCKSINSSSLKTQCMPEDVRHINLGQIKQKQVHGDHQPGYAPRRRHSQDNNRGCILLEPTAHGTVAGLCSGRYPMAQRDKHSKNCVNIRGALTVRRVPHIARVS